MRHILAAAFLVGCGTAPQTDGRPEPLVFERYSPPQFTSHDIFIAAHGDTVVLATRISRDGGSNWEPSPFAQAERVAIHGNIIAGFTNTLVRYDVATRALTPVAAPSYATARTWRTTPQGRFIVFDAVHNAIAFETSSGWTTATLPQPTPTEFDPYITDIESNGSTILVVSAWGVYRASNGDAFARVMPQGAGLGRELVALADARFALLGGSATQRFDANGAMIGESAGISVGTGDAVACDDGALVALGEVSRDSGASWQPLLGGGALPLTIERVGCGGGRYWVLGHSTSWGYRLLRYDGSTAPGLVIGNWELAGEIQWASAGPPILRLADGTFIAGGLAWRDGEASWSLREVPTKTWVAGERLFGLVDGKLYASADAGRSWQPTGASGLDIEIERLARAPDGTLHASRFASNGTAALDEWHAIVWRSSDGVAWSVAYDASATREPNKNAVGEVHRFVGITSASAWIATDAISNDLGVTWRPTEFDGDKSLASLTPDGHLVTPRDDVWHVFEAGGAGKLVGTWQLEAEHQPVPASQLRSVAFDEAGYAYVARGTPYVTLWRSTQPIVGD
jgi:hypothetical protein